MALANIGYALAANENKTVGLVDLDCEAAALHDLFRVPIGEASLLTFLVPKNRLVTSLERHVVAVPIPKATRQALFLIPTVTDSKVIDDVRWDKGVESFLKEEVFPAFGRLYNLDLLLIDSRSGVSSFAQFALQICDLVILVGRADRQNRAGLRKMVEVCRSCGKSYLSILNGCPAPERNRAKVQGFVKHIASERNFVIPYEEALYFDEMISTKDAPRSIVAKRYVEVAQTIDRELR